MNYRELFSDIKVSRTTGNQVSGYCPFHQDSNPSFSYHITDGLWKCFSGCGEGDAADYAKRKGLDPKPYYRGVSNVSNGVKSIHTEANRPQEIETKDKQKALEYHKYLIDNYDELIGSWPVTKKTLKKLWVGYDKALERFTFPHFNHDGKCINIKHHKGKKGDPPFSIPGYGGNVLYPMNLISTYSMDSPIIYCEGEKDAISLISNGYQAVTNTTGAGNVPKDISALKDVQKLFIVLDNDEAGRVGSEKVRKSFSLISPKASIKVVLWDKDLPDKWDITDSFVNDKGKTLKRAINKSNQRGFNVFSVNNFINKGWNKPKPIIENLLYEKGISVIAGSDGVGKSWIGLQIALSVSSGESLFNEFIVDQKPVLLVQFEMNNGGISSRLKKMMPHFKNEFKDLLIVAKNEGDGVFIDNWVRIEDTLKDNDFKDGILIVDNLYTSTDKNLSQNEELAPVLSIIDRLRNQFNLSIVLIAHHNKDKEIVKSLNKNQITGGKTLTNFVNNVFQIAESSISNDLRVAKITKIRDAESELRNIPFKLHFNTERCIFTKGSIISNEAIHYIETKKRWELEILKELSNYDEWLNRPEFDRERLLLFIPELHKDKFQYPEQITRYLNKMIKWGFVQKTTHGKYKININEINQLDA